MAALQPFCSSARIPSVQPALVLINAKIDVENAKGGTWRDAVARSVNGDRPSSRPTAREKSSAGSLLTEQMSDKCTCLRDWETRRMPGQLRMRFGGSRPWKLAEPHHH
jgi:hypothetical protein